MTRLRRSGCATCYPPTDLRLSIRSDAVYTHAPMKPPHSGRHGGAGRPQLGPSAAPGPPASDRAAARRPLPPPRPPRPAQRSPAAARPRRARPEPGRPPAIAHPPAPRPDGQPDHRGPRPQGKPFQDRPNRTASTATGRATTSTAPTASATTALARTLRTLRAAPSGSTACTPSPRRSPIPRAASAT